MMMSMGLLLLMFVLCFTNLITQCYGQNESHLEDLLSDLMAYFQSKSIVIHSNKMNVFKSKILQGYVYYEQFIFASIDIQRMIKKLYILQEIHS